ncbi:DUF397 domain-containing protein [Streptomyces griseosporeus]
MSAGLQWFKSSYSGDQGECLEVALEWMRSSWSDGEGECGEIASSTHTIHIRDSKNPATPHLTAEGGLPDLTGPIERPADTRK